MIECEWGGSLGLVRVSVQVLIRIPESLDFCLMELDGLVDGLDALELDAVGLIGRCLHVYSLHAISQSSLVAFASLRADLHEEDDHCQADKNGQDQIAIESHVFFLGLVVAGSCGLLILVARMASLVLFSLELGGLFELNRFIFTSGLTSPSWNICS